MVCDTCVCKEVCKYEKILAKVEEDINTRLVILESDNEIFPSIKKPLRLDCLNFAPLKEE